MTAPSSTISFRSSSTRTRTAGDSSSGPVSPSVFGWTASITHRGVFATPDEVVVDITDDNGTLACAWVPFSFCVVRRRGHSVTGTFLLKSPATPPWPVGLRLSRPSRGKTKSPNAMHPARCVVRRRGLEPPSPYGRYHLKVVRLPISPPAHAGSIN